MHKWIALAFVTIALAGCASDDEPVDDEPVIDDFPPEPTCAATYPDPTDRPADLTDAVAAATTGEPTANLQSIGEIALGGEEADAWGDFIAVDRGSTISIIQMAVQNGTAEFSEVSSFTGNGPKDVKWSDDGQWIFTGNDAQGAGTPAQPVTSAAGQNGGFDVYEVSDKAAPTHVSHLPTGPLRGPHMVFYHRQADCTELVFGANADVSINRFDRDTGTLTELSRYAPDPVNDVNRDPQVIDAYYQLYTHDMFVMEDPVAEKTLMYTASWDAGVHIVDVTDPANPQKLGMWNNFGDDETGNLHTVATEWIGDRRITVGSVEVGFEVVGGTPYLTGNERSVTYVWDTTDLADPSLLSTWENPQGIGPGQSGIALGGVTGDEVMSTHNLQLEQGRIYMAHYGLGVWVLDVSSHEAQAAPKVVAFSQDAGNLWDTIVHKGVILTSGNQGLGAYHFPADVLGEGGIHSRA